MCSNEVDEALGQDLFRLMSEGPEGRAEAHRKCAAGDHGQYFCPDAHAPQGLVHRFSRIQGRFRRRPQPRRIYGLVRGRHVRGCLFATTARLLKRRGQAMQAGGAGRRGGDGGAAWRRSRHRPGGGRGGGRGRVCTVANDNDPSQVVISGHKAAIDRALRSPRKRAPSARSSSRSPRPSTAR